MTIYFSWLQIQYKMINRLISTSIILDDYPNKTLQVGKYIVSKYRNIIQISIQKDLSRYSMMPDYTTVWLFSNYILSDFDAKCCEELYLRDGSEITFKGERMKVNSSPCLHRLNRLTKQQAISFITSVYFERQMEPQLYNTMRSCYTFDRVGCLNSYLEPKWIRIQEQCCYLESQFGYLTVEMIDSLMCNNRTRIFEL